ncbi:MAG: hypothetical protein ACSHXF_04780 [Aquaticitalea sp.]
MKKVFSVLAVVFFMSSSFTSSSTVVTSDDCSFSYDHCFLVAGLRTITAQMVGFSPSEAYEMGNTSYDHCVDTVDIEAAMCLNNQ